MLSRSGLAFLRHLPNPPMPATANTSTVVGKAFKKINFKLKLLTIQINETNCSDDFYYHFLLTKLL